MKIFFTIYVFDILCVSITFLQEITSISRNRVKGSPLLEEKLQKITKSHDTLGPSGCYDKYSLQCQSITTTKKIAKLSFSPEKKQLLRYKIQICKEILVLIQLYVS